VSELHSFVESIFLKTVGQIPIPDEITKKVIVVESPLRTKNHFKCFRETFQKTEQCQYICGISYSKFGYFRCCHGEALARKYKRFDLMTHFIPDSIDNFPNIEEICGYCDYVKTLQN